MKAHTKTRVTGKSVGTSQTVSDFKNSLLIVSVVANLFILTTWLVIEASPSYALSLVSFN